MRTIVKNHPTRKNASVTHHIPTGFDQAYDDLINYNGTFSFVLEMRSTINKYGKLSDKQWNAVMKCLAPKPAEDPNVIAVASCSLPITVSASAARYIAKANQWTFNPRTFVVTQIKSKNNSGYMVRAKVNWIGNVSECRCCGKTLEDWRSQATGVGPYCVKKTGIPYVKNQADVARFQKEMEVLAAKLGEVEVFIKKWHLNTGSGDLDGAIENTKPVTAPTTPSPSPYPIIPVEHFKWDQEEGLLLRSLKESRAYVDPSNMPDIIQVYSDTTKRAINFRRRVLKSGDRYISTNSDYLLEVIFE
jgi:hypothetical protein